MSSRCPFSGATGTVASPAGALARLAGEATRRLRGALAGAGVEAASDDGSAAAPSAGAARLQTEARELVEALIREDVLSREAGAARLAEVQAEIAATGTYEHTTLEVEHGARLAWRNAARCIGRLYWRDLIVRDQRQASSAEEVFAAIVEHLRLATNGGKLRPVATVFAPRRPGRPGPRVWNPQLIRYAGYRRADGSILGDPAQAELTEVLGRLGWAGGAGTPFDVLPLVIQMPGEEPRIFELPRDAVLEVPLTHPDFAWFGEMGLRWHAVPAISNMRLEIGGLSYTAAPFNGWYVGTEIGARNLADEDRYNLLPTIARQMALPTRSNRSLWRDRALIELNVAVLHSFQAAGVTAIDHHVAGRHFVQHEEAERKAGRVVPGDWSWLVPPMSGSTSPLWSRPYRNVTLKPAYLAQRDPWKPAQPPARSLVERPGAAVDDLTGLRRARDLPGAAAGLAPAGGAVAVLDLDELGRTNAEHGQSVGDAALRAVGRAVLAVLRPDDAAVRSADDEVSVVLPGIVAPAEALRVAARVRAAVGAVYLEGAPGLTLRASMGVALCRPGGDPSAALARARLGLQRAKLAGRDAAVLLAEERPPTDPRVADHSPSRPLPLWDRARA